MKVDNTLYERIEECEQSAGCGVVIEFVCLVSSLFFLSLLSRQAFSFSNTCTRWAKNDPCRITCRCLASSWAIYGPYRSQLDWPFRRAINGPLQMRRPVSR